MRYLVGVVCVFAALVASPLSVSAQDTEEGATTEPSPQEPAPSSEEPTPEEPALKLDLDDAGVQVAPSPPRTPDGYTLKEMDGQVRGAGIGLGVSMLALGAALGMVGAGVGASICVTFGEPSCSTPAWSGPVVGVGLVLAMGGISGTIASAILLARRKRDRDGLRQAHHSIPRRVQWDLARSRLVF